MRDLPFIHQIHRPDTPDGSAIIHLHGTGGDESDLMPLAHSIAPNAMLVGVRGRSTEEGINRWFRRFDAITYDQDDIRAEAEAFAGFVEGAVRSYGLDPDKLHFLGYSNGANLLGAVMLLHPGVVKRAILLRGIAALSEAPKADLKGTQVLMASGMQDPFAQFAPPLEAALKESGATVDARTLPTGHGLTSADRDLAAGWLSGL